MAVLSPIEIITDRNSIIDEEAWRRPESDAFCSGLGRMDHSHETSQLQSTPPHSRHCIAVRSSATSFTGVYAAWRCYRHFCADINARPGCAHKRGGEHSFTGVRLLAIGRARDQRGRHAHHPSRCAAFGERIASAGNTCRNGTNKCDGARFRLGS